MQNDVALVVNSEDIVHFDTLEIAHVGLPLRHIGTGMLVIKHLKLHDFTADAFNSYGNIHIEHLEVDYYNPDFVYSDNYHADALGQLIPRPGSDSVSNVTIGKITANVVGDKIQGIMLSEPVEYYNFSIGAQGAEINMDYPYAFVANTLADSYVNVGNNGIKIKKVKQSLFDTSNVWTEKNGVLLKHNGDIVL